MPSIYVSKENYEKLMELQSLIQLNSKGSASIDAVISELLELYHKTHPEKISLMRKFVEDIKKPTFSK